MKAEKPAQQQQRTERVTFTATVPPCARAVDFHGDGGARLQLDIPESDKPAALQIAAFFLQQQLRVTIEVM